MRKPKNQLNKKRLPKCRLVSCRHTLTCTQWYDCEGKCRYKMLFSETEAWRDNDWQATSRSARARWQGQVLLFVGDLDGV